jgi:quinol monooxygenase YgiN
MAQLHIRPECREDFAAAVGRALDILAAAPGCQQARVLLGIEEPDEPRFLIRWDSVEAHESFRDTPAFADYRATIAEFFSAPPSYRHFEVGSTGEGSR